MSPLVTATSDAPGFARSWSSIGPDRSIPWTRTPRRASGSATRPVPTPSSRAGAPSANQSVATRLTVSAVRATAQRISRRVRHPVTAHRPPDMKGGRKQRGEGGRMTADEGQRADRLAELFRAHHDRVLAYAVRRVGPEAAADVAAETFAVAVRRHDAVPVDAELPWLLATARNLVLAHSRTTARRRAVEGHAAALDAAARRHPADPSD